MLPQIGDRHRLRKRNDDILLDPRTHQFHRPGVGLKRGVTSGKRPHWHCAGRPYRFQRAGTDAGRARWLDPPGHAEPMHLADHRIAGDAAAEFAGDLACAQSVLPKLAQEFDALVCPGHVASCKLAFAIRTRR